MKKIIPKELDNILELHKKWLEGKYGGLQADLHEIDLYGAKLVNANLMLANLSNADLRYANLDHANLCLTNLEGANLEGTNLHGSNSRGANFHNANLQGIDLQGSDLTSANLQNANLQSANLSYADLQDAILQGTNLTNIKYNYSTIGLSLACPEQGSFIGYKVVKNKLIKLLIPEDAKRSSATTKKCRCSKAKVLSITDLKTNEPIDSIISDYDNKLIYKVGKLTYPDSFDDDRWSEYGKGINFFVNKNDALMGSI